MQTLGIDLGFGFTKATDGERSLVVKSVIGEATDGRLGGPMAEARPGNDHLHLELEDRGVFVGDLAERQSALRSFTLDQDRFITDAARILAVAVAAELTDSDEPVGIVTGLPIATYRQKADELARVLRDRHSFISIAPDGSPSAPGHRGARREGHPAAVRLDVRHRPRRRGRDRRPPDAAAEGGHRQRRLPDLRPHGVRPRHVPRARQPEHRDGRRARLRHDRGQDPREERRQRRALPALRRDGRGPHQDPRRGLRPQPPDRARARPARDGHRVRRQPPLGGGVGHRRDRHHRRRRRGARALPHAAPERQGAAGGRLPRRAPQQRPRLLEAGRAELGRPGARAGPGPAAAPEPEPALVGGAENGEAPRESPY